jgi:Holliday junction resolvase
MVNSKNKGKRFEREVAKKLNQIVNDSEWKRIPGSGALGTILDEPRLGSDVRGKIASQSKDIVIEAKSGYGGSKQLTVKREWFNKLEEEAEKAMAFPVVACKFSGSRKGTRIFIAMDIDRFAELMNYQNRLYNELQEVYKDMADLQKE